MAINNPLAAGASNVVLTTTGGAITQTAKITGANLTANATGGAIALTNAANDLTGVATLTNSGAFDVFITDANALMLGATTAGNSLAVTAPGGITLTGNITSGLHQTYNSNVVLGTDITASAGPTGNVIFSGFIDGIAIGAQSLTVNASLTIFNAGIGGGKALSSLTTTDPVGLTSLSGTITTTGAQTYNGNVQLNNNTTINGLGVTFAKTISGAKTLLVNDSGTTVFGGGVSGVASLTTDAAGSTNFLSGGNATGAITLNDNATLSGNFSSNGFSVGGTTVLTGATDLTSPGGGAVTFTGTVDGTHQLTVNTSGATIFGSVVGATTPLLRLITNAGGTSSSVGVTTTAQTDFNDSTTLNGTYTNTDFFTAGTTTLAGTATTINAGAGNVTFTGFIDGTLVGAQSLDINSSGATKFLSGFGGGKALASLNTDAGGTSSSVGGTTTGITRFLENTTLTGAYNNAGLTVGGTTTLAGTATTVNAGAGAIIFNGTVDATTAGIQSLTANSTGATTFGGIVGGTVKPATLTTNAGGTLTLTGVSTTGSQSYGETTGASLTGVFNTSGAPFNINAPVTLLGDTTINAGAGSVTFGNFIDGTAVGVQSLTINSTGVTTLPAGIGGGKALLNLTTDAGGTTAINGPIFTTGAVAFNDAVSGNAVTLNAGAGSITATNPANDFIGVTTFTGGTIQVTDVNALNAVLNASGASTLTAGLGLVVSGATAGLTTNAGSVAQSAPLLVSGPANITATSAIVLTNAGNDFSGPATFTGGAVRVTDLNALSATLATSGATILNTGGNLSVSGSASSLQTVVTSGTTDFGATTVSGTLSVNALSGAVT